jgi:ketosteroid isomerase-like protein
VLIPAISVSADNNPDGHVRREANIAAVGSFFGYMNGKDIDSWIALWADDGTIFVPYPPQGVGFPTSIDGRDQILTGFKHLFDHFTSYRADVRNLYPTLDPDVVIVEWSVEAHLTSGGVYKGDNITVFRFRHGKIAGYHDYFNPELFRVVVETTTPSVGR